VATEVLAVTVQVCSSSDVKPATTLSWHVFVAPSYAVQHVPTMLSALVAVRVGKSEKAEASICAILNVAST